MDKDPRKWPYGVLTVLVTLILGVLDWLSGYDFNFFVFYFLPVSLAAWFLGRVGAVSVAILSSIAWLGADALTGHRYSSNVYAVWNTMIRLVSFLAIGWSVSTLKHILDREREVAGKLRKSLSEIKVLESFLPVCAHCRKIRDKEGVWQPLEVYIQRHTDTQFSHCYCPDCHRRILDEAESLNR